MKPKYKFFGLNQNTHFRVFWQFRRAESGDFFYRAKCNRRVVTFANTLLKYTSRMNPLTNIEVERLMSVLSQTNRNLEILCYVPLDLISSNNNNVTNKELFQELPESLVRHIESHIKLLGERTNSNLPKAIKQSTRSLCRTLIVRIIINCLHPCFHTDPLLE